MKETIVAALVILGFVSIMAGVFESILLYGAVSAPYSYSYFPPVADGVVLSMIFWVLAGLIYLPGSGVISGLRNR